MMDNPEKLQSITIPFFGTFGIKYNNDEIDKDGNLSPNITVFNSLNENFKKMVRDISNGDSSEMIQYLKDNYIHKIIENIEET